MHSSSTPLNRAWLTRLNTRALPTPARLAGEALLWNGLRLGEWYNGTATEMLDVELASMSHPLASEYGFMLFVGASPALCERARPLLDALAPVPGAWLWCGPMGSAQFCQRVFDAVLHIHGPLLSEQLLSPRTTPDWADFFTRQLDLADKLRQLADDYRARHHDHEPLTLETLAPWLTLPPKQQSHYALTLARLLSLALAQQQAIQPLFEQLLHAQQSP